MRRFLLLLLVTVVAGCAHAPSQKACIPSGDKSKELHNEIDVLQQEVDVLAKHLRREQLIVEPTLSETNSEDVYKLSAITNSLERQKVDLEKELEAMSHVLQSPF